MPASVLIIGEDPELIDFSAPGLPPGLDAAAVRRGLEASRDRLRQAGHAAEILLLRTASVEEEVAEAMASRSYDVIVIGAGLRTMAPMIEKFERLINVLRELAPRASIAFNSRPDDSDVAALRWIDRD